MEKSEFDQHFADKMRKAGAPDFSDEDWERLHPQLDALHHRRWRAIPLWWLAILSALLICSNLLWWWMWRQTEQSSQALRTEWQQVRQGTGYKSDTTWKKVVVYQHDTVYRTIVHRIDAEVVSRTRKTGFTDIGKIIRSPYTENDPGNTTEQQLLTDNALTPSMPKLPAEALTPGKGGAPNFDAHIQNLDSMSGNSDEKLLLPTLEPLLSDIDFLEIPRKAPASDYIQLPSKQKKNPTKSTCADTPKI